MTTSARDLRLPPTCLPTLLSHFSLWIFSSAPISSMSFLQIGPFVFPTFFSLEISLPSLASGHLMPPKRPVYKGYLCSFPALPNSECETNQYCDVVLQRGNLSTPKVAARTAIRNFPVSHNLKSPQLLNPDPIQQSHPQLAHTRLVHAVIHLFTQQTQIARSRYQSS